MIKISDHDKKILGNIGRGAYGKELIEIIKKITGQLTSLDSVDKTKDYTPQVEGRILFKEFSDELVEKLSFERRQMRPLDADDFE